MGGLTVFDNLSESQSQAEGDWVADLSLDSQSETATTELLTSGTDADWDGYTDLLILSSAGGSSTVFQVLGGASPSSGATGALVSSDMHLSSFTTIDLEGAGREFLVVGMPDYDLDGATGAVAAFALPLEGEVTMDDALWVLPDYAEGYITGEFVANIGDFDGEMVDSPVAHLPELMITRNPEHRSDAPPELLFMTGHGF